MNSDSSYIANKEYVVYLDLKRLPTGEKFDHAEMIAASLLKICGLTQVWDEPRYGRRLFHVKELPQDIPQAGLYWIEAHLPTLN